MAKKTNLKVVEEETQKEKEKRARVEEEESWRLSREEIAYRVGEIRRVLEEDSKRYNGALFDVVTDSLPRSLDGRSDNREPYDLANYINPSLRGHYNRCSNVTVGPLEDDLCTLQWEGMETAFQIGILAGFIFAGCSEGTIDRVEQGLISATTARRWEV